MAVLSLMFLKILALSTNESLVLNQRLDTINDIFRSITITEEVQTIAYFGNLEDVTPYLTVSAGIPKVVITEPYGDLDFYEGAGFNNQLVYIAVGRLDYKAMWTHMHRALANIQGYARGIFIIPNRTRWPLAELAQHFSWCWRRGFADVLVLLENQNNSRSFEAFSYSGFPDININDVRLSRYTSYFPHKYRNMRKAKVRTPVLFDPPRVFIVNGSSSCSKEKEVRGYATAMFTTFLKRHNGVLDGVEPMNLSSYGLQTIIDQMHNSEIDFSMHPYMPVPGVHLSYPIKMMQWCIIVPFSGEIEALEYFLRPFQWQAWLGFIVLACYMSCVKCFSDYILSRRRQGPDFWRGFLFIMRLMLSQCAPTPKYCRNLRLPYAFWLIQVALLGFMLSNLYLASLTSYLTTPIYKTQLNSLLELVQHNIKVHVLDSEIPTILTNRGLPKAFAELLVPRNFSSLVRDILALRPGNAYMAREDLIEFALMQQRYLLHPPFHQARECITTIPVGFLLPSHSQFESVLNLYIMSSAAAGLTDKWDTEKINMAPAQE